MCGIGRNMKSKFRALVHNIELEVNLKNVMSFQIPIL